MPGEMHARTRCRELDHAIEQILDGAVSDRRTTCTTWSTPGPTRRPCGERPRLVRSSVPMIADWRFETRARVWLGFATRPRSVIRADGPSAGPRQVLVILPDRSAGSTIARARVCLSSP